MSVRLTSTAPIFDSASWSPADDVVLQLTTDDQAATVQVQARVDAAAAWATIGTLTFVDAIQKFAKLPFMRLSMQGNTPGKTVTVRDNVA